MFAGLFVALSSVGVIVVVGVTQEFAYLGLSRALIAIRSYIDLCHAVFQWMNLLVCSGTGRGPHGKSFFSVILPLL